jgi:hypothetical protein
MEEPHMAKPLLAEGLWTDRTSFGLLGHVDDGDAEGTMLRHWPRAVTLLRQPPRREQLTRLA